MAESDNHKRLRLIASFQDQMRLIDMAEEIFIPDHDLALEILESDLYEIEEVVSALKNGETWGYALDYIFQYGFCSHYALAMYQCGRIKGFATMVEYHPLGYELIHHTVGIKEDQDSVLLVDSRYCLDPNSFVKQWVRGTNRHEEYVTWKEGDEASIWNLINEGTHGSIAGIQNKQFNQQIIDKIIENIDLLDEKLRSTYTAYAT